MMESHLFVTRGFSSALRDKLAQFSARKSSREGLGKGEF